MFTINQLLLLYQQIEMSSLYILWVFICDSLMQKRTNFNCFARLFEKSNEYLEISWGKCAVPLPLLSLSGWAALSCRTAAVNTSTHKNFKVSMNIKFEYKTMWNKPMMMMTTTTMTRTVGIKCEQVPGRTTMACQENNNHYGYDQAWHTLLI